MGFRQYLQLIFRAISVTSGPVVIICHHTWLALKQLCSNSGFARIGRLGSRESCATWLNLSGELYIVTMWPPLVKKNSWFINSINYIVISIINHIVIEVIRQLSYLGGPTLYVHRTATVHRISGMLYFRRIRSRVLESFTCVSQV